MSAPTATPQGELIERLNARAQRCEQLAQTAAQTDDTHGARYERKLAAEYREAASALTAQQERIEELEDAWLPIVLCPTDGVDRRLKLPDGSEVIGAYHNGGLGELAGWKTKRPVEIDEPVYEYPVGGGFIANPSKLRPHREPERQQIGTRKAVICLVGRLPEGVYPTHFRPNDTVHGSALSAISKGRGQP